MRNFRIIILIATTCFLSCNYANNKREKPLENETDLRKDTINNVVTLSLEKDIYRLSSLPEIVKVKLVNNSNEAITTGLHYHIEAFDNDNWNIISPKDMPFHDIGFNLEPSDQKYFEKKLMKDHINFKPGKYRIVKYYLKPDFQVTKEQYFLYAEFKIE